MLQAGERPEAGGSRARGRRSVQYNFINTGSSQCIVTVAVTIRSGAGRPEEGSGAERINLFETKTHRKERRWFGWDEAEKGREAEGREIN